MTLCIPNKLTQSKALLFFKEIPHLNISEDTEYPLLWFFSGFSQSLLINPAKSSLHIFPTHNRGTFQCNMRRFSDIPVRTHTLYSAASCYRIMRIASIYRVYGDSMFRQTTGTHLLNGMTSYPKWRKCSSPVWKIYFIYLKISRLHQQFAGRDSSVGIATRYGLDGPGIESRLGRDFPQPSRPVLEAHPASYTKGTGSFPGLKRPGRGVNHLTHLPPRLKKE